MSKENQLVGSDQNRLIDNINQVYGVLELLFCVILSEHPIEVSVLPVITDAQIKMKEIKEAVDVLTAA